MLSKRASKSYLFVAICALAMALGLVACGGNSNSSSDSAATTTTAAQDSDPSAKGDGVMSFADYTAAAVNDAVVIEGYVQGKQAWWDNKASLYLADGDGAYFVYEAACPQDVYDKLVEGQKVKVNGYKGEWSGEIEVMDATLEIEDGNYIAEAEDVTSLLGTDDLIKHQNEKVSFKDLTIAASKDSDGNEVAYLYNWDGSGEEGDDLYFNVSKDGKTYSFTVESYLCDKDSDVYKAVKNLKVGDTVDMEGFLYWYEGANPHITSVTVK